MKWLPVILLLGAVGCATNPQDRQPSNPKEAAKINAQLGVQYMRQGQHDRALPKLQTALKQDPNLQQAHAAIALLYAAEGEVAKARAHYNRALTLDPVDSNTRNNYAAFLCGQGDTVTALAEFERVLKDKRYPTPEGVLTNAGVCARGIPDLARAEKYFRSALKRNSKHADALSQLALLNYERGQYLQTRAFLQRYEAVAAPTPEMLLLGLRTERELGDKAAAAAYAEKLRATYPDVPTN
ncbi:MAG: type IV pilus biogenesis/stability protein PilW [Nevskiales bacterium]